MVPVLSETQDGTWKEIREKENYERQNEKTVGGGIDHSVAGNVSLVPVMCFLHVEAAICAFIFTVYQNFPHKRNKHSPTAYFIFDLILHFFLFI